MTTSTKATVNGVDFRLLLEGKADVQAIADILERAMAVYKDFDFAKKLECVVFFRNRQDFTDFYASEYGLKDEYSDEGHAIHYPYGTKSIIGVGIVDGMTEMLLTHELGHAIEHDKLKRDGANYEAWKGRDGYIAWSEFFCQAHASYGQRSDETKDFYLTYYPEILKNRVEMFNQDNIDRTFLYTIYSMSDLFYHVHTDNTEAIDYYLEHYASICSWEFTDFYKTLYDELDAYLRRNGFRYDIAHDYKFFERLERYKEDFTDFFKEKEKKSL